MNKEVWNEVFNEYHRLTKPRVTALGDREVPLIEFRAFEKKLLRNGFLRYYEVKNIKRSPEGYKEFLNDLFLQKDRLLEMSNMPDEEAIEIARLNLHLMANESSQRRQTVEFIYAIVTGIVSQIYLDWKWWISFILAYALIKAILVYRIAKQNYLSRAEFTEEVSTFEKRAELKGAAAGYGTGYFIVQFLISVLVLGAISAAVKFLTFLAMKNTIALVIISIFGITTVLYTIRKIQKG